MAYDCRSDQVTTAGGKRMVEPSGIEVVRDPGATSWCQAGALAAEP